MFVPGLDLREIGATLPVPSTNEEIATLITSRVGLGSDALDIYDSVISTPQSVQRRRPGGFERKTFIPASRRIDKNSIRPRHGYAGYFPSEPSEAYLVLSRSNLRSAASSIAEDLVDIVDRLESVVCLSVDHERWRIVMHIVDRDKGLKRADPGGCSRTNRRAIRGIGWRAASGHRPALRKRSCSRHCWNRSRV